jgi:hypothetical protein
MTTIGGYLADVFLKDNVHLYRALNTFPEFLELNNTFLCFLAAQEDGEAEKKVLEDLIQLNKYGFLALRRQSGDCGVVEAQSTYQLVEKRGHIVGLMTLEQAKVFIAFFYERDDVFISAMNPSTMTVLHTNYPFQRSNVMRTKNSVMRDGLDEAPWSYDVNVQPGESTTRHMFQVKVLPNIAGISETLAEIHISAREYGKGSMEALLLDFYSGRAPIARGKTIRIPTSFASTEDNDKKWNEYLDQLPHMDKVYYSIDSFSQLRDVNIKFLKGEMYATPYHTSPIMEETLPLLGDLIQINKCGFISTGGQPSECDYIYKSALLESEVDFLNPYSAKLYYEYPDGYYYWKEQNGHIEGFLQRDMAMDLIGFVSQRNDVNINAHDFKTASVLYTNTPHGYFHSREKMSKSLDESTPWKICVSDGKMVVDILDAYGHYPRIIDILKDCVGIVMYTKKFGEGSPESVLLDFFKGR